MPVIVSHTLGWFVNSSHLDVVSLCSHAYLETPAINIRTTAPLKSGPALQQLSQPAGVARRQLTYEGIGVAVQRSLKGWALCSDSGPLEF